MNKANTGGRAWCRHIKWGNQCKEYFCTPLSEKVLTVFHIPRSWKFCPLCSKPRPAEKHRREGKDER